jgi:choline kinase
MKAIIYAAGTGRRLENRFGIRPKLLIEFGGHSLLDWHIQRLKEIGCHDLVVVTGYLREQLEPEVERLGRHHNLPSRSLGNPDYLEGSVLSFAVSIPELEKQNEPLLLMDGDVLYPAEMLRRLWRSPHRTALLVDRNYSTEDDDPVLVPMRAGRPFDFCKKWKGEADAVGESIGFFKCDPRDIPRLIKETRYRLTGLSRRDSYDDVLRMLVMDGRFGAEDVTGLPWTEIDFPSDAERAEREVLPAILRLVGHGPLGRPRPRSADGIF